MDRLLWNTEKRFVPDAAAISLVTDAAMAGLAGALDLGAALVLVQAGRLHLDGLEYEIFQGAHAAGMRRVSLSLIHAAAALDRYAARCADLGEGADANAAQLLRHQAAEYHRAAVRYREMAARYGELADSAR